MPITILYDQKPGDAPLPALLQQAIDAHKRGDPSAAAPLYRQFLALNPDHPLCLQLLGLLYSQQGDYTRAVEFMRESLRLFPGQAEVHNNLGNALAALGRLDEAILAYREAVRLLPRYAEAWKNLGIAHARAGQLDHAAAAFAESLVARPEDASTWLGLAHIHRLQDNLEKAASSLEKAIRINPDYAEARFNLGITLHAMGDSRAALEHLEKARDLGLEQDGLQDLIAMLLDDNAAPASGFAAAMQEAEALRSQGRLDSAEQVLRGIETIDLQQREAVLRMLVDLNMQADRVQEVITLLVSLTQLVPDRLYYYGHLASLLENLGRTDEAITHYERLLQNQPRLADAYFNIALLYKKSLRYADALAAYQAAIDLGISNLAEVYSNTGVLLADMHRFDEAREMYTRALELDPQYIPALFNLGGLCEECGDASQAAVLYRRILEVSPQHWDSLARLAGLGGRVAQHENIQTQLRTAAEACRDQPLAREGLLFALGKSLDDAGDYGQAFQAYQAANELGKLRFPAYDDSQIAALFKQLEGLFTEDFIRSRQTSLEQQPVFICGMPRSGSTLVEQILAGHPAIRSGGELDYMPWLVNQRLAPFPQSLQAVQAGDLEAPAQEYLERLTGVSPGTGQLTDKRPDNFIFIGLIRTLFPRARILYTRREPADNCLSIYFQQLGGDLNYSTSLENTARYYLQHAGLMRYWVQVCGENIHTVDYDELVVSPEPVIRSILAFLGLPWDQACLEFNTSANPVRTASLWQVREPLHTRSSGRSRHYKEHLVEMNRILGHAGPQVTS